MPVVIPPAGVTPAGFFVPETYADPAGPPAILADPIDPSTGEFLSIARSYDPTDACVIEALRVERGSGPAVLEEGNRIRDVQLATEAAPRVIEQEAQYALRRFVEDRQIRIDKIAGAVEDDLGALAFQYTNLRSVSDRPDRELLLPAGGGS